MSDDAHLDLLTLDALRAGDPPTAAQRAHLAWCASCQATLADLEALATALRRPAPESDVPADRDAAVLALARARAAVAARQADHRRQRIGLARRWAAAAVLVLAVGGLLLAQRRSAPMSPLAAAPAPRAALSAARADLDGDGRVTVLDAFALARAVTRGTPRLGDADRHDVDTILAMAVAIDDVRVEP